MKYAYTIVAIGLICIASGCCSSTPAREVYDVPRLDSVHIDGQAKDWGSQGFRVEALTPIDEQSGSASDLNASFHLAWDPDGLLVLGSVCDDMIDVSAEEIWKNDGAEIFLGESKGGRNMLQLIIAPGKGNMKRRTERLGYGREVSRSLQEHKIDSGLVRTPSGYMFEARMPWSAIGVTPEVGREVAFQLAVNDIDADVARTAAWFPSGQTHKDTAMTHRIRLAEAPSEPVKVAAWSSFDDMRAKPAVEVTIRGATEMVGEDVTISHDEDVLAHGVMKADNGWAVATVPIPTPPRLHPFGKVVATAAGKCAEFVEVPDLQEKAAREMMDLAVVFENHAFNGTRFPPCRVECTTLAHKLLGDYAIETTYYDADYHEVTRPEKHGRYGAITTVKGEDGINLTRNVTLYRSDEILPLYDWYGYWDLRFEHPIDLPKGLHISDEQAHRYAKDICSVFARTTIVANDHCSALATSLAAINESKGSSEPIDRYNDSWSADRQWWLGLKRKLNGNDKRFAEKLARPHPVTGEPALVLHEGTLAEAGMKPDAAEKIDAFLKEWAADSDEGFIACVARNGVIVLHKAYGERDGKKVGLHSACDIASITKLWQGTCMMMLVDQGLVDLDAPVARYLPEIAKVPHLAGLTVRHVFTHTTGLSGIRGDFDPSFEHKVAEFGPFLKYGEEFLYTGKGLVLGSKVMEQVTGKTLPQLYKTLLVDPLGCADTQATTSYGDTFSTALDLAKLGQMLANSGAYGNVRFFGRETFENLMLPRSLGDITNGNVNRSWGIGCYWMDRNIFSERTIGHGSATKCTLRIDLANNLVVSMTRSRAGTNYDKYHRQFLQTVADAMIERK